MALKHFLELLLLASLWGASFMFMRTAAPEFGPVALIEVRTVVASLFLLPLLIFSRHGAALIEHWRSMFVLGLINTAIPFTLLCYTTLYATAGYTSLLNATTPIFSAIVAYFWLKEKLPAIAVIGIIIGFSGVATLVMDKDSLSAGAGLMPILAALTATFMYGVSASYTQHKLKALPPLALATGSQLFAAIALLPLALMYWPDTQPSGEAWLSAAVLGIACSALAYILYFRLIQQVGIARTVMVTYLVPIFGMLWGTIFLAEHISILMLAGGATILLGTGFTAGLIKLPRSLSSLTGNTD